MLLKDYRKIAVPFVMLFKVLKFLKASFVEQKNVMLLRNEAVVEINRREVKDFPFNSLKIKLKDIFKLL